MKTDNPLNGTQKCGTDSCTEETQAPMSFDRFKGMMRAAMAVPKEEIDALEQKEREEKPPRKRRQPAKKAV